MSKKMGRTPDGMKPKLHFAHPVTGSPACALGQKFETTSDRRRVTCGNCRESVAYRGR